MYETLAPDGAYPRGAQYIGVSQPKVSVVGNIYKIDEMRILELDSLLFLNLNV